MKCNLVQAEQCTASYLFSSLREASSSNRCWTFIRVYGQRKIILAIDEYDAAVSRGEMAGHGGDRKNNLTNGKLENAGLTYKQIHEARAVKSAIPKETAPARVGMRGCTEAAPNSDARQVDLGGGPIGASPALECPSAGAVQFASAEKVPSTVS